MYPKANPVADVVGDPGTTQRVVLTDSPATLAQLGVVLADSNDEIAWGAVVSLGTDVSGNSYAARFACNVDPTQGDGGLGHDLESDDNIMRIINPTWLANARWISAVNGQAAVLNVTPEFLRW